MPPAESCCPREMSLAASLIIPGSWAKIKAGRGGVLALGWARPPHLSTRKSNGYSAPSLGRSKVSLVMGVPRDSAVGAGAPLNKLFPSGGTRVTSFHVRCSMGNNREFKE